MTRFAPATGVHRFVAGGIQMIIRSNRPTSSAPLCVALLIAGLVGCGSSTPPNVAGKDSSASAPDPKSGGGATGGADAGNSGPDTQSLAGQPPPPVADDPAVCAPATLPHPDLDPLPVHPCTAVYWYGTDQFRYDATGRVVYLDHRYDMGSPRTHEEIHSSVDEGDSRIETVTL